MSNFVHSRHLIPGYVLIVLIHTSAYVPGMRVLEVETPKSLHHVNFQVRGIALCRDVFWCKIPVCTCVVAGIGICVLHTKNSIEALENEETSVLDVTWFAKIVLGCARLERLKRTYSIDRRPSPLPLPQ